MILVAIAIKPPDLLSTGRNSNNHIVFNGSVNPLIMRISTRILIVFSNIYLERTKFALKCQGQARLENLQGVKKRDLGGAAPQKIFLFTTHCDMLANTFDIIHQ